MRAPQWLFSFPCSLDSCFSGRVALWNIFRLSLLSLQRLPGHLSLHINPSLLKQLILPTSDLYPVCATTFLQSYCRWPWSPVSLSRFLMRAKQLTGQSPMVCTQMPLFGWRKIPQLAHASSKQIGMTSRAFSFTIPTIHISLVLIPLICNYITLTFTTFGWI